MECRLDFSKETLTPDAMLKDLKKWKAQAVKEKNRLMEWMIDAGDPRGVRSCRLFPWLQRSTMMASAVPLLDFNPPVLGRNAVRHPQDRMSRCLSMKNMSGIVVP